MSTESNGKEGNNANTVLGAVFSSGDFVKTPRLLRHENGSFSCPCCDKHWNENGKRSAYGFVVAAAQKHVGSCFEKLLLKMGLRMKNPYNMEKLAWELEKIAP